MFIDYDLCWWNYKPNSNFTFRQTGLGWVVSNTLNLKGEKRSSSADAIFLWILPLRRRRRERDVGSHCNELGRYRGRSAHGSMPLNHQELLEALQVNKPLQPFLSIFSFYSLIFFFSPSSHVNWIAYSYPRKHFEVNLLGSFLFWFLTSFLSNLFMNGGEKVTVVISITLTCICIEFAFLLLGSDQGKRLLGSHHMR